MKFTKKIVANIKHSCRDVCGGRRSIEIGRWLCEGMNPWIDGLNLLLEDGEDGELEETVPIDSLIGTEIPDRDGWIGLDCYCYNLPLFGRDPDNALDDNVYVLIAPDGSAKYASNDDLEYRREMDRIIAGA